MPSPGADAIAATIGAKAFVVEGGLDAKFAANGELVQRLAEAVDAGWTSATPTTPTSMGAAFDGVLGDYVAGRGRQYIDCIADGIDQETADWVASWDTQAQAHTYVVNAASIVGRIQACAPLWSAGAQALAEAAAEAFMSGFVQEGG